jgi:hypothetical protein
MRDEQPQPTPAARRAQTQRGHAGAHMCDMTYRREFRRSRGAQLYHEVSAVRFSLVAILLTVALVMTACASSSLSSRASAANEGLAAQDLPFRWTVQSTSDGEVLVMRMLPLPVAPSRANAQLTGEILEAIRRKEQGKGRTSADLKEVRQMPDGREVWILQSLLEGIAYVVSFGSASQGVTRVVGPYSYSQ